MKTARAAMLALLLACQIVASTRPKEGLTIGADGKPTITLIPPKTPYWARRQRTGLYAKVLVPLARQYAGSALTVLDVGAYDPGFLSSLSWIPTKLGIDLQASPAQTAVWKQAKGVNLLIGDFDKFRFAAPFDLVTSNQVVEHLPHGKLEPFIRKLMLNARVLIVSTTLNLPADTITGHVQDPISEQEFRGWFRHQCINGTVTGTRGEIVAYRVVPGGNPNANNTLPNARLGRRVAALNQVIVWRRTPQARNDEVKCTTTRAAVMAAAAAAAPLPRRRRRQSRSKSLGTRLDEFLDKYLG